MTIALLEYLDISPV